MKKSKADFPIYLGVFIFVVSILAISIKLGQNKMITAGKLLANRDEARLNLNQTGDDLISINFSSTKEISGADLVLTYDKYETEILPSTLLGASGYISTGGEIDANRGTFSFSAVNTENPIKNGILAVFRIKNKGSKQKIDFLARESKIYDLNLSIINTVYGGLN